MRKNKSDPTCNLKCTAEEMENHSVAMAKISVRDGIQIFARQDVHQTLEKSGEYGMTLSSKGVVVSQHLPFETIMMSRDTTNDIRPHCTACGDCEVR